MINKQKNFFCSSDAKKENDSLIGTASFYSKLLLIEYSEPMGSEAFENSNIPENTKNCINLYGKDNPELRVLLIRNEFSNDTKISIFALTVNIGNNIFNHHNVSSYSEINIDLLNDLFSDTSIYKYSNPMYLICTNGKKDKCCSKFGLPIYKYFSNIKPNLSWQCSHIGGDRFAPTALILPSFANYGHIEESDVLKIINCENEGNLYIPKLRGKSNNNFYEQAADCLLRKKYKIYKDTDIEIINSFPIDTNIHAVRLNTNFNGTNKLINVKVIKNKSEYFNYMDCETDTKSYSSVYKILEEVNESE